MKQWFVAALLGMLLLAAPGSAVAAPLTREQANGTARGAAASRTAAELSSRPYSQYTYYSELAGELAAIARRAPERVTVLQQARSANGHPLYLVVITSRMTARQRQINDVYRTALLSDPGMVLDQQWLRDGSDIRPAVFINANIHGDETTGMDAALRLIRRLAFRNDVLTRRVLDGLVVVVNPCQNPDGRIANVRANGNGFDLNRDFVALTQPETWQTVRAIRRWLPLAFTDLHGFVSPTLIEPTTFPHNPALEYDLLAGNALHLGEAQAAAIAREGHDSQIPSMWGTAADSTGSANEGWDDYPPYYAPQIAQQYGSLGQTIEVASRNNTGVDIHYRIAWETVAQCLEHRWAWAATQAGMLARGDRGILAGRPWQGTMPAMLRSADPATGRVVDVGWFLPDGVTKNPAFPYRNEVGATLFPYAYLIPVDPALQRNPGAAEKFVVRALSCGLEVQRATQAFAAGGATYPAGTYVVLTEQPLRALAHNLLWDGEDVRAQYGVSSMYDVAVWSLPYAWGFDRAVAEAPFSADLAPATAAGRLTGGVTAAGPLYAFAGDELRSIRAVTALLRRGLTVGMVTQPLSGSSADLALGSFVVDAHAAGVRSQLRRVAAETGVAFTAVHDLTMAQTARLATGRERPRLRVNAGDEAAWVLRAVLGFDRVTSSSAPGGDVFVNGSAAVGVAAVQRWLDADPSAADGRRTYIGITAGGSSLTGLIPGVRQGRDPDPLRGDNGFCPVSFAGDVATAGYRTPGYVFAYPAAWLDTAAADDAAVDVEATYLAAAGGVYHSGFWSDPSSTAAAVGKAAMVTYEPQGPGARGRVVLMGFSPLYRAQTEGSFLLVARQILLAGTMPPGTP